MNLSGGLDVEAYDRAYTDAQLVRRIAAYFRPQARRVALVALMVALASLVATITPLAISRSLDLLDTSPGVQLLVAVAALVALARVLLQDPAILLLDEATASIDPCTEAQVQAALAAVLHGRTSVVVAHRLSTVRAADRIIVHQGGRIIEAGDHPTLLAQGGYYATLYATYFRQQALAYEGVSGA